MAILAQFYFCQSVEYYPMMQWYQRKAEDAIAELASSLDGLSRQEAAARLEQYGPNEIKQGKKQPPWMLFLNQFKDFMILVLVVAAIVSGIVGDITDTVIILVIIVLNAIVGFVQEYNAGKAIEALKQMSTPHAHVRRNGHKAAIDSATLVPGDIVLLEAGNMVPADIRLVEAHSLRTEESSLTGESIPVDKISSVLVDENLSSADMLNMAFKGTMVVNGRGSGIVVGTGMNTEIGKIAGMLQQKEKQTPLQNRMADFGKKLSWIILGICVVLFVVGLLHGEPPLKMLLLSISLAVAAIPEALPALITVSLAKGAGRMVKEHALVRKLPAVETLGAVSFVCSDKTGTLTQNKMTVVAAVPHNSNLRFTEYVPALECAMILNHDVKRSGDGKWLGDPTEVALVDYVVAQYEKNIVEETHEGLPRVAELPFDSDRKCMTTIHKHGQRYLVITKGAVEAVLAMTPGSSKYGEITTKAAAFARSGNRVIAYGYRILDELPLPLEPAVVELELELLGIVAMIDPPREEVKTSIQVCKSAGIKPVMITGDHVETAKAIAHDIGLLGKDDLVITGAELYQLTSEEFSNKVEQISVYARVSPEQKLGIVKALQGKGHFVAMTGDGVNDAPSLRAANIGIAMGISGTDVSKEAAHIILQDDNFATIVTAIKEGRRIYDNIRKFIKYIMTCNSAEILTIFLAPIIGLPNPLQPIHILWINLVTDGLPGLALSSEQAERNIMSRPPRRRDESLFNGIGMHIVWMGILMAGVTLGTQAVAIQLGDIHWQTMVFTVLSLAQLGHVFAIRSNTDLVYSLGMFSNRPLTISLIFTFVLQLGVIYLPFANEIFHTQPLSLTELLICIGVAAIIPHAVEIEKLVVKYKSKRERRIKSV